MSCFSINLQQASAIKRLPLIKEITYFMTWCTREGRFFIAQKRKKCGGR